MRTEQFLEGYDSCRRRFARAIIKHLDIIPQSLVDTIEEDYYEDDPKTYYMCFLCKYFKEEYIDWEYEYVCKKGIDNSQIHDCKEYGRDEQ